MAKPPSINISWLFYFALVMFYQTDIFSSIYIVTVLLLRYSTLLDVSVLQ